ncbi:Uma2 family endonuclease [Streptomyces sp. NBC_01431]|uniref:Uma2 family endonuclease n=1 Tax=Streptomyces sp. NBC_01431 TaxID=2903863 RepID=UPI002E3786ED|nr:Uma2 family endonuclease [Streptomyces sp. NBC_01431]
MAVILNEMTIGEAADRLSEALPGHRVEVLKGSIVVTPPPDGPHQETVAELVYQFRKAGGRESGLKALPGIGVWLGTGPDDYAEPDWAIVDADYKDAAVTKNCYAANVFRLVLEVTSSNWGNDLVTKAETYAEAGIPVYVIADRKHGEVLVLTDPVGDAYRTRSRYERGSKVVVPQSVGLSLELPVDVLLDGDGD